MNERVKTELSCGELGAGASWYPLRKWWRSSQLFNQVVGLPPPPEMWDPQWMNVDGLQRSLAACSWPAYSAGPLWVPYISRSMDPQSRDISEEQCRWRVILDVAHFSPSELCLSVTDGFLEVRGKHEERPDEHGFIARCFTKKYRLPAEMDATKIVSTLSVDGILTVEAPIPETSVPAAIIIPIKVEMGTSGENQEEEASPTNPDSCKGLETPDIPSVEDEGGESPLEVQGDQAHPHSTAWLQKHEERGEQEEESCEKPAGESKPFVPADGEGAESPQDSAKHQGAMESHESSETGTFKPLEHRQPAMEVQVMADSREAAEEIGQPDKPELEKSPQGDQSQELEDPDIKQERTE